MNDVTSIPELKGWINGLQSDEARNEFARRCETSIGHLRNVAYGKKCAAELAALIELASGGVVRRWHLRPRDWHRIWLELIGQPGAPEVGIDGELVPSTSAAAEQPPEAGQPAEAQAAEVGQGG